MLKILLKAIRVEMCLLFKFYKKEYVDDEIWQHVVAKFHWVE